VKRKSAEYERGKRESSSSSNNNNNNNHTWYQTTAVVTNNTPFAAIISATLDSRQPTRKQLTELYSPPLC
jgi:hypothetical protein